MDNEMTLGQWMLTLLLSCIPCVGIIMLFIWAFGNGEYIARKHWAQAQLIFIGVFMVLCFIIILIFGASAATLLQSLQY